MLAELLPGFGNFGDVIPDDRPEADDHQTDEEGIDDVADHNSDPPCLWYGDVAFILPVNGSGSAAR